VGTQRLAVGEIGGRNVINLRYHVFSLMAVFAALAIGIVVGSTTVKSGLVDSLRSNVERAEERIAEVEDENARLAARDEQLDMLADEGAQLLVGELVDEPVLWVSAPGVDGDVVDGLARSFEAAGAISLGIVVLDEQVFGDDAAGTLADVLGSTSDDLGQLRNDLGSDLADRIDTAIGFLQTPAPEEVDPVTTEPGTTEPATTEPATTEPATTEPGTTEPGTTEPGTTEPGTTEPETTEPETTEPGATEPETTEPGATEPGTTEPGTTEPGTTEPDTTVPEVTAPPVDAVLQGQMGDLEDSGVIDLRDISSRPLEPGALVRVVIVEDRRTGIDTSPVLLSVVDSLGEGDGSTEPVTVVVEAGDVDARDDGAEMPESLVQIVRSSGRLRDEVSTVDNGEEFTGWAAAVLAVRNGIVGDLGHYGYRDGSERLLPRPLS
jgi:hypothetical protein